MHMHLKQNNKIKTAHLGFAFVTKNQASGEMKQTIILLCGAFRGSDTL